MAVPACRMINECVAERGMSTGAKVVLWVLGGLGGLTALAAGGGYYWWKTKGEAWGKEMREMGQRVMAEGKAAGASASKDQCVQLAIQRWNGGAGIMEQVRAEVFLESCLNAASGSLPYCADAPKTDEIMATVSWRLKTSESIGLAQSENPIVKGIQKHCVGR
jgi:hypothetical protein